MSWNYRVIQFKEYCTIHSVYYEENKPYAMSENPEIIFGDNKEELRNILERMLESLEKPVLDYKMFQKKQ